MKIKLKFFVFALLLVTSVDGGMAQNIKFSMEPFKTIKKEWGLPKDKSAFWSILDECDGTIIAYKVENYKRKIRRFDYNFNIIAEFEYKNFDYDIYVRENGIDILYNHDKNSLAHWVLDAKALQPVKDEILDISDDYYYKKVEVNRSSDNKYVRVKAGSRVHYYDNMYSPITENAEIERIKDMFPRFTAVYRDDKSSVFYVGKGDSSGEYYFDWCERAADGSWKTVQRCDFGKEKEDYTDGKLLKVKQKMREWVTVFIYNNCCYWLEFETYWNGWTSKNDVYRLLLKSFDRNGNFQETELSTEFKMVPSVFVLSDGRCLIWQQYAKINKDYAQRIGMLKIE